MEQTCAISPAHRWPFYTIGYSHKTMAQFTRALKSRRVAAIIDIRLTPVSIHRPEFSKRNLAKALDEHGIAYVHVPALGVPREVRSQLAVTGDYGAFFEWYDVNVIPRLQEELRPFLLDPKWQPMAFMCMEDDQSKCHRQRVALALRRAGLTGFEIG